MRKSKPKPNGKFVSIKLPLHIYTLISKLAEEHYRTISGELQMIILETAKKEGAKHAS